MSNHVSHAALPYPIKNARYSILVPYLDADGDPTAPTTPDTEVSKDNGAAADCAEEASATSGMDGMALLTLTGAETNASTVALNAKVASGPKATLATLFPRVLAVVGSGTLSAGSAGGGTLGTLLAYDVTGCFLKTTGGTGGGGTGGANNQARKIITYNVGTGAFTVAPDWETTPDATTTYEVLLPEGLTLGALRALNPATAGRTLVVDAAGLADANAVKVGPTGSGTAQTARDLGGQLDAAVSTRAAASALTTAQNDLDILTGADGATLATAQALYAPAKAGDAMALTSGERTTLAAAIWNALTSGMSTVGSIGKRIVDYLTGAVALDSTVAKASALATAQTSIDDLPTNAELATALAALSIPTAAANASAVWAAATRTLTANTNLNDPTAAAVAAAVVAETITELSAIPAASPTLKQALALLYMALRNKVDVTGSAKEIHTDAGAVLATKSLSDDGTTYSEAKMA